MTSFCIICGKPCKEGLLVCEECLNLNGGCTGVTIHDLPPLADDDTQPVPVCEQHLVVSPDLEYDLTTIADYLAEQQRDDAAQIAEREAVIHHQQDKLDHQQYKLNLRGKAIKRLLGRHAADQAHIEHLEKQIAGLRTQIELLNYELGMIHDLAKGNGYRDPRVRTVDTAADDDGPLALGYTILYERIDLTTGRVMFRRWYRDQANHS